MFSDEAVITVSGGHGGAGRVAFFPKRQGPCGGDGGRGGDVYIVIDANLSNLNRYVQQKEFHAPDGAPGGAFNRKGHAGTDLFLPVPAYTTISEPQGRFAVEITAANSPFLICRGGAGGYGNDAFKSATNQTPRYAQPGRSGQIRTLKLVVKLIADCGLIGLPNAGKTSLLNALTNASARVAAYPFTTVEPNLGVMDKTIIADIPGLIEGASRGKGLGIKFLKHIEKVKLLLHCLSAESSDLKQDYQTINEELGSYSPALLEKPQVVLLTKADLLTPDLVAKKLRQLKRFVPRAYPVSIHDWDALEKIKTLIRQASV
ncbi:GTPase ObgE [Patescibacteria group bacterium]|nr:GTPase ObgE [Patescibacteria group bacterium]MCL5091903.1 GTPase ObgE [Patescibacteria group bacterium]